MKRFTLSVVAIMAMSTFAIAGGDIGKSVVVADQEVIAIPEIANDSGFYFGIAYGMGNDTNDLYQYAEYKDDAAWIEMDVTLEVDANTVMLQSGYKFNKYFAVEGRYWKSFGDLEMSIDGSIVGETLAGDPIDEELNGSEDIDADFTAWGLYIKPMYPVTEAFDIYALLGYGNVEVLSLDESGFQWGLGASYEFTNNLSVFADYVQLYSDSDETTTTEVLYIEEEWDTTIYTVNFGLSYRF